jgi:hypothetical protein
MLMECGAYLDVLVALEWGTCGRVDDAGWVCCIRPFMRLAKEV